MGGGGTVGIDEWGEYGLREGCLGSPFGILILWITFISFLGKLYLCWLERERNVRGGEGVLLSTLPRCLGWSPHKAGLGVG